MTATAVQPNPTVDRLELAAKVAELREQGLLHREVAARLGISRSYASVLATDPDGAQQARRRESYKGVCELCGAETKSDGTSRPSPHCPSCAPIAATYWTRDRVIEAFREFHAVYGRAPTVTDFSPSHARNVARKVSPAKRGRYEEMAARAEAARWPLPATVAERCGSFAEAIEAAGLPANPRQPHWTKETIVEAIRAAAVDGVPPTAAHDVGLSAAAIYHFGRWKDAVTAAGFKPRTHTGKRVTHHEIVAAFRSYHARYGFWPRTTVYQFPGHGLPSYPTVVKRFGSWQYALAAAQVADQKAAA